MALLACSHKRPDEVAYSGGILCYIYHDSVRILDVHGASGREDVVDLKALVAELSGHHPGSRTEIGNILSYQNGILRMALDLRPAYAGSSDVVIDVRRNCVSTLSHIRMSNPVRLIERAPRTRQVITHGRYLVYVYSYVHVDGCDLDLTCDANGCKLKCYDLSNPEKAASIIALGEFLKEYPCLFKLFGGWLYGICPEEWFRYGTDCGRLYYRYCRFPIDGFPPAGPWKPAELLNHSSYTPLPARLEAVRLFRGVAKDVRGQGFGLADLMQDERTGEVFIVETGPSLISNNGRRRHRYRRIIFPDPPAQIVHTPLTRISEIVQTIDGNPCSSAHQFPPHAGAKEICEYFSAFRNIYTSRTTVSYPDERSLIILTKQAGEPNQRDNRIILVNFDSGIHFPGFKPLTLESFCDKMSYEAYKREIDEVACDGKINLDDLWQRYGVRKLKQNELDDNQQEEASESRTTTSEAEAPDANPWFYNEPAMHLAIGKGFQFHRYPPKPTAG